MATNWVTMAEKTTVVLSIGLVASFFLFGMAGGGQAEPETTPMPSPTASPTTEPPAIPDPTGAPEPEPGIQPGVPLVSVGEMETWPPPDGRNQDRQLDYRTDDPSVVLPEAPSADLHGYWDQEVSWDACGDDECARVLVPLDWENPGEAALHIAMRRVAGADPSLGPLFVNPGGPGHGGQNYAQRLGEMGWDNYDVVGWDPRGTGESTGVQCGTTEQTDARFEMDATPEGPGDVAALRDGFSEFAQQCRDASGPLLDHLSTIENVRDLDLLRHLLGAQKLNYVGASYGTYVGAMYAQLFPERAGRLVLDSAVDITDDVDAPVQAEGFELALRNYAQWCVEQTVCVLGDTADDVVASIADFLANLKNDPIPVGDRLLTQNLATAGIALFLYADEQAYPTLTQVVSEGFLGRGALLLSAANSLNGRRESGYDTSTFAFPATLCVDWEDRGVDYAYGAWQEVARRSPVFGAHMGMSLVCETWTADSVPPLKITAEGAPTILVVGTTGDSATPYEHAVSMAEQLSSAVLLTLDGPGHGAVTSGNECISRSVAGFLIDGEPPQDGTVC